MMQMLEAGGMPILIDDIRKSDENNPFGYYEYEKVKTMKEDTSWLGECEGKALKIISALLYHLPGDREYKIIFMERILEEILASQEVMLDSVLGKKLAQNDRATAKHFQEHLDRVKDWLAKQRNIHTIYVNYGEAVQNPFEISSQVARFIGGRLQTEKMANAVRQSLYRSRSV